MKLQRGMAAQKGQTTKRVIKVPVEVPPNSHESLVKKICSGVEMFKNIKKIMGRRELAFATGHSFENFASE